MHKLSSILLSMRLLSMNINNSKKPVLMVRWGKQGETGLIIKSGGKKTICKKHIQRNVIFKKQHPRTWRVNGWKSSCSSSVFLSFDCNLEKELSHRGAWVEGGRIWLWSACHYQDLSPSIFACSLCLTLSPSPLCLGRRGCSATVAWQSQNISEFYSTWHIQNIYIALYDPCKEDIFR